MTALAHVGVQHRAGRLPRHNALLVPAGAEMGVGQADLLASRRANSW